MEAEQRANLIKSRGMIRRKITTAYNGLKINKLITKEELKQLKEELEQCNDQLEEPDGDEVQDYDNKLITLEEYLINKENFEKLIQDEEQMESNERENLIISLFLVKSQWENDYKNYVVLHLKHLEYFNKLQEIAERHQRNKPNQQIVNRQEQHTPIIINDQQVNQQQNTYVQANSNYQSPLSTSTPSQQSNSWAPNQPIITNQTTINEHTTHDNQLIHSHQTFNYTYKLIAEDLEVFDGNVLDYPQFRQNMISLILQNDQVPQPSAKLRRIITKLPREAKDLLASINKENPDLNQVLSILDQKYGSARELSGTVLNKIAELKMLSHKSTLDELIKFRNLVVFITQLPNVAGFKEIWLQMINAKLENAMFRAAYRNSGSITFEALKLFLDNEIKIVTEGNQLQSMAFNLKPNNKPQILAIHQIKKCTFCDSKEHTNSSCPTTNQEKIMKLKQENRCFNCTSHQHTANNCPNKFTCKYCQQNHLNYMCKLHKPSLPIITKTDENSNEPPKDMNVQDINETNVKSRIGFNSTNGGQRLNQTTTILMNNIPIRICMDTGADQTLITNNAVKKLNLQKYKSSPMELNGLAKEFKLITNERTKFHLKTVSGQLKEYEVVICDELSSIKPIILNEDLQEKFSKEFNIQLCDKQIPIDILIGIDILPEIIYHNQTIRINPTIIAQKTTLGWFVYGINYTKKFEKDASFQIRFLNSNSLLEIPNQQNELENGLKFVENYIEKNIKIENNSYVVKLPIIPSYNNKLESNYYRALNKLNHNIKNMKQDQLEKYDNEVKQLIDKEAVQKIENFNKCEGYYMPHFAVINENRETTKVRIVYNASDGKDAINKYLFKGFVNWNVIKSLINFRSKKYAAVADIQSAFHTVKVDKEHQKFLRFLWPKNIQLSKINQANFLQESSIDCYQFVVLPFGLTCSPFLLYSCVHHLLQTNKSQYPETVNQLQNTMYVDDCIFTANTTIDLQLRRTESEKIFKSVNMNLRKWHTSCQEVNNQWNKSETRKEQLNVLGVAWNLNQDTISINIPRFEDPLNNLTKRKIVSLMNSIYDPLGIILPATIPLKLTVNDILLEDLDWDNQIPTKYHSTLKKCFKYITEFGNVKINRRLFDQDINDLNLVLFCDAGAKSIGVMVYLEKDNIGKLIYCKSKIIKPTKVITAELLSLSLAADIAMKFKLALGIKQAIVFSDNETNVNKVNGNINNHPFHIAVHLFNIKQKVEKVIHVAGLDNPADALTKVKFINLQELQTVTVPNYPILNLKICKLEKKNIEEFEQFSTFEQAINHINENINKYKEEFDSSDPTTILIKIAQYNLPKQTKYIIYTDDNGIKRLLTRLSEMEQQLNVQQPIFIESNCFLTNLLINKAHQETEHGSISSTMNTIRNHYFIPKLRQKIRNFIKRCQLCQEMYKQPYPFLYGQLPKERILPTIPFEKIGIDHFEFKYKNQKKICLLFVCMTTRAIHVELVKNTSSIEVLYSLYKFGSIRNYPNYIISDNATGFTKIGKFINENLEHLKIKWNFIIARTPQKGGFYEIMVKLFKKALNARKWDPKMDDDELPSVIYELTKLINNRPLFFLDNDYVTPNHFIFGKKVNLIPTPTRNLSDETQSPNLKTIWYKRSRDIRALWTMWQQSYIKQLRLFHQNKPSSSTELNIGDKVLSVDSQLPRTDWKIGEVVKKYPDNLGHSRIYDINLEGKIVKKDISKLVHLEESVPWVQVPSRTPNVENGIDGAATVQ